MAAKSEYGGKQRESDLPPLPSHHHHHRFIGYKRERVQTLCSIFEQALAKQTEVKEEEKEIGSVWVYK